MRLSVRKLPLLACTFGSSTGLGAVIKTVATKTNKKLLIEKRVLVEEGNNGAE